MKLITCLVVLAWVFVFSFHSISAFSVREEPDSRAVLEQLQSDHAWSMEELFMFHVPLRAAD